jgi:hypothetical protein
LVSPVGVKPLDVRCESILDSSSWIRFVSRSIVRCLNFLSLKAIPPKAIVPAQLTEMATPAVLLEKNDNSKLALVCSPARASIANLTSWTP